MSAFCQKHINKLYQYVNTYPRSFKKQQKFPIFKSTKKILDQQKFLSQQKNLNQQKMGDTSVYSSLLTHFVGKLPSNQNEKL